MRIRHYAQGKFYTIGCPEGSAVVRPLGSHDVLIVPLNGTEIRIPANSPELLPLLAESGNFGVSLIGEPEPDGSMVGVVCPECGQDDVTWLQLRADETVRCDACGGEFTLPSRPVTQRGVTKR